MRILQATVVLLIAGLTATATAQTETATPMTSGELTEARGGEILVEAERGELNRGVVIGWVNAPVAEVAEIVRDTDTHEEWFPDTVESREISSSGTSSVSEGRTHVPIVRDRYWRLIGTETATTFNGLNCVVMHYDYDQDYEDGNMNSLFGYWLLCPYDGGTAVKYTINADLGIWLPNAIVNWAQRRMLPGIVTGLQERHAELH